MFVGWMSGYGGFALIIGERLSQAQWRTRHIYSFGLGVVFLRGRRNKRSTYTHGCCGSCGSLTSSRSLSLSPWRFWVTCFSGSQGVRAPNYKIKKINILTPRVSHFFSTSLSPLYASICLCVCASPHCFVGTQKTGWLPRLSSLPPQSLVLYASFNPHEIFFRLHRWGWFFLLSYSPRSEHRCIKKYSLLYFHFILHFMSKVELFLIFSIFSPANFFLNELSIFTNMLFFWGNIRNTLRTKFSTSVQLLWWKMKEKFRKCGEFTIWCF